jgi:O-antigen ligase
MVLNKTSSFLRTLARISFAAAIILIAFRLRLFVDSRPIELIYRDYMDFILFASDVLVLVTLLLWFLALVIEKRKFNFGPVFLSLPLAALTVIVIISSVTSIDVPLSVYNSARVLVLDVFYLYIVNEIQSLAWVAFPAAIQSIIQAIVGILQTLDNHSLGLRALGELELDPAWSGVSIVWAAGVRSLRAYGLSDHPNILGGCFAFSMLLLAAWYLDAKPHLRGFIAGAFALAALGLLLTFSRSAWLALASGSIAMILLLLRTRHTRAVLDFAGLTIGACLIVLPFIFYDASYLDVRINQLNETNRVSIESRSIAERIALAGAANQIFADRPLLGVGVGALPQAVRLYFPEFEFFFEPAHIAMLEAAAETGIFGALAYFVLSVAPWIALWWNRKQIDFSIALIGASAALLAITVVGVFDYYPWLLSPGRLWQWTLWGLWAVLYNNSFRSIA